MSEYYRLTEQAIEAGQLKNLILGEAPYAYRNKWSAAPGPTDLGDIYEYGICEYAQRHPDYNVKSVIQNLVIELCNSNAGIYAMALIILSETYNFLNNKPCLHLDLRHIASQVNHAIVVRQESLKADMTLGGTGWPEGLLDEMRRLSKNTEEIGGPPFYY